MSHASSADARITFLLQHGATEMDHSADNLLAHLRGVESLLAAWGARPELCAAGLFHSVYGTEVYPDAAVPLELRPEVRALIGAEAEEIAYLFGVIERLSLFDNLFDAPPFKLIERTTGRELPITRACFADLCDLTVANWLEQRPRFPASAQFSRRREFELMLPFVLPAAREALRRAYDLAPVGRGAT